MTFCFLILNKELKYIKSNLNSIRVKLETGIVGHVLYKHILKYFCYTFLILVVPNQM